MSDLKDLIGKQDIIDLLLFCNAREEEATDEGDEVGFVKFNQLYRILCSMLVLADDIHPGRFKQ